MIRSEVSLAKLTIWELRIHTTKIAVATLPETNTEFSQENWWQRTHESLDRCVRLAGSGCVSRQHSGRRWCWFLVQAELFDVGRPKHIHPSFYWWEHGTWLQRGNMNPPWNLTSKYPKWCHMLKPKVHFLLEKLSCLVSIFGNFFGGVVGSLKVWEGVRSQPWLYTSLYRPKGKTWISHPKILDSECTDLVTFSPQVMPVQPNVQLHYFGLIETPGTPAGGPVRLFHFTRMWLPPILWLDNNRCYVDWVNLGSHSELYFFHIMFLFSPNIDC